MIDSDGFRPNVGIILCNDQRKLFWAKRIGQDAWQFPQGGINENESPEEAMFRELGEEVGLKPDQVDQDDLPPYELLDGISRAYIEENKALAEIVAMGFDPAVVKETICRIDRTEYKRHQAPPGLKVTTKSFGYGRRYPIAQKYLPTCEQG